MKEKRAANKTPKTKRDVMQGSSRPSSSNGGGEQARKPVTQAKPKIKGGGDKKSNGIEENPSKIPVRTGFDKRLRKRARRT
jgi:hypothetical protein